MSIGKRILCRSIGMILFVVILSRVDFEALLENLEGLNYNLVLFSVGVFFLLIFIKTCRWFYICLRQGVRNLSFYQMYIVYCESYFAGSVTPGRLGEVIKYKYIYSKGFSVLKSLYSVLVDRVCDIAVLVLVAYGGMFYFTSQMTREIVILTITIVSTLLLAGMIIYKRQWVWKVVLKGIETLGGKKIENVKADLLPTIKKTRVFDVIFLICISLLGWMVYYWQVSLFAKGLNIEISYLQVSLCVSISSLFGMVPITIAGVGTRDATLIFLFSLLGLPKEEAIALSLMILLIYLVNAILSAPFWLLNKQ